MFPFCASSLHLGLKHRAFTVIRNALGFILSFGLLVFASRFVAVYKWKRGREGFAHSVVLRFLAPWSKIMTPGQMWLNAYRRAGVRMQTGAVGGGWATCRRPAR